MSTSLKNRLISFMLISVMILVCGCASGETAEEQPVEETVVVETPVETKTEHERIAILFTGNIMGNAKTEDDFKPLKDRAEELKKNNTLVDTVDCGNHVSEEGSETVEEAVKTLKAMASAGYSHVVLNEHEFDFGIDGIRKMLGVEGLANMSCNFRYSGFGDDITLEVLRSDVVEIGSVKIGYIAISDINTQKSHKEDFIEDGRTAYSFCGRSFSYLSDTVQASVDICRSNGADYVIVLSGFLSNDIGNLSSIIMQTAYVDAFLCTNPSLEESTSTVIYDRQNREITLGVTKGGIESLGELVIEPDGQIHVSFT